MSNDVNIKEITFGELIEHYKIVIPKIQRDYAQGREQEKVKAIKFLKYVKEGINSFIDLDFIYGSVKGNDFEPIDGQQRLTTVFLLYYYSTLKSGKYEEFLQNFSYELRPVSRDFFKELTKEENWQKLKEKISNGENLVKAIENSNWFFKTWKKDPTVSAVLRMLEWIETEFKKEFEKGIINPEKIKNNVKFKFLPLEEYNLGEDIYVKMNARGKPLTNFENFKARLYKYITDPVEQARFDNEYLDIFWNIAKERTDKLEEAPLLADRYFYALLYHTLLNFYTLKKLTPEERLESFIEKDPFLDFGIEIIEKDKTVINNLLKFLKKIHKKLSKSKKKLQLIEEDIVLKTIIDILFKEELDKKPEETLSKSSYEERVKLHIVFSYLVYNFDDDYIRVLFNLANNTRYDTKPIWDYIEAIKAIERINKAFIKSGESSFLKWLAEKRETDFTLKRDNDLPFFRTEQRKEEIRKAKLIINDPEWREPIEAAEKHWYLQGYIGFLIDFSNGKIYKFKEYYEKFKHLWDFAKEKEDNQILLYRALLTIGNYMPEASRDRQYRTFCNFEKNIRERLDNWIKVFENSSRKEVLKELLNKVELSQDLSIQLSNIIKNYQENYKDFKCKDWIALIIDNPELIKYSKYRKIYIEGDERNPKRVLIPSKKNTNSFHRELFSWNFFKNHFRLKPEDKRIEKWRLEEIKIYKPFQISYYLESSSRSIPPKIIMEGAKIEGKNLRMEIYYKGGWHIILTTIEKRESIPDSIKLTLDFLFKENENKLRLKNAIPLCEEKKLIESIEQICTILKNSDLNNLN